MSRITMNKSMKDCFLRAIYMYHDYMCMYACIYGGDHDLLELFSIS